MSRERDRATTRRRRHLRIRRHVGGTAQRPRLCVYKSLRHIYAQLIDDREGRTLAAASTRDGSLGLEGAMNAEAAAAVGKALAERAQAAGISEVVFDRGGWPYHGRIQRLAEAAREAGLQF